MRTVCCEVSSIGCCISVGMQGSDSDSERSAKQEARREKKKGKRQAHEARVREAAVAAERAVAELERRLMFESASRAAVAPVGGKWVEGGVQCCENCFGKSADAYHPDDCSFLCVKTFGPLPVAAHVWRGCKSVHYAFRCHECGEEPPVPTKINAWLQKAWAGLGDAECYQQEAVEAHWRLKRMEPVQ